MTDAFHLSVDEHRGGRLIRRLAALGTWFMAAVATQSSVLALVLLGFVYAAMRRQVTGVVDAEDSVRSMVWNRTKLGVTAALTVASITLLPGVLWAFAWHAGWDNSFNKGYEQTAVGASLGLLGLAIFAIVMPYLQIAQVRHAVSRNWRTFYQLGLNLRIWGGAPGRAALLAVLYFFATLPAFVLFAAPTFFSNGSGYPMLSDAEVAGRLELWYLLGGAVFVLLLFAIKRFAASVYSKSLRRSVARGWVDPGELTPEERVAPATEAPGASTRWRVLARTWFFYPLVAALWSGVAAQVFVAQFVNNQGLEGWLNQPLLHVPVVKRMP